MSVFIVLVCKLHTYKDNVNWQSIFSETWNYVVTWNYAVTSYNSFKLSVYLTYSTPTAAGLLS